MSAKQGVDGEGGCVQGVTVRFMILSPDETMMVNLGVQREMMVASRLEVGLLSRGTWSWGSSLNLK